jgi:hypothetical protein
MGKGGLAIFSNNGYRYLTRCQNLKVRVTVFIACSLLTVNSMEKFIRYQLTKNDIGLTYAALE